MPAKGRLYLDGGRRAAGIAGICFEQVRETESHMALLCAGGGNCCSDRPNPVEEGEQENVS